MKHMDRTHLTRREEEILELQRRGFTYKQIAEELHISRIAVCKSIGSAHKRIAAKERAAS